MGIETQPTTKDTSLNDGSIAAEPGAATDPIKDATQESGIKSVDHNETAPPTEDEVRVSNIPSSVETVPATPLQSPQDLTSSDQSFDEAKTNNDEATLNRTHSLKYFTRRSVYQ